MPRQPFQDHPSEHPGSWAKPWSADEMLDGQHQRMDVLAHATTAHDGLSLNGTGRGSLLSHPSAPADEQLGDFGRVIRDLDSGPKGCGSNPRSCSDPSTARPISPASLPVVLSLNETTASPHTSSGLSALIPCLTQEWGFIFTLVLHPGGSVVKSLFWAQSTNKLTSCKIIIPTPESLRGPQWLVL